MYEQHDRRPSHASAGRRRQRRPKGARAWYNAQSPPFALWVAGHDNLVDGDKLLRRFATGREPHARLIHQKVIPGYEHLDVLWAMDADKQIFTELRDVLWRTVPAEERARCRTPMGCHDVQPWVDDRKQGGRGTGDREIFAGPLDGVHESGSGRSSSEEASGAS